MIKKNILYFIVVLLALIPSFASAVIVDTPIEFYAFYNGSISGTVGNTVLTKYGSPVNTTGKYDNGYNFTASGQHFTNATNTKYVNLSYGGWFYETGNGGWVSGSGYAIALSGHEWVTGFLMMSIRELSAGATVKVQDPLLAACEIDTGWTMPFNEWHHIMVVINGTAQTGKIYIDGVLNKTVTSACSQAGGYQVPHYFSSMSSTFIPDARWYEGIYDEIGFWNVPLTADQVYTVYSSPYPFTASATTDLYLTATDEWTTGAISAFSVNISWSNGTTTPHSSAGGNIYITNVPAGSTNITFWNATNYFPRTYLNHNIANATNNTLAGSLHQTEVCFNATAKVSGSAVTLNNVTINGTTRTVSPFCFNITASTINALAQKTGWYSRNQSYTIAALSNTTQTFSNISYANLTVSAKDGTTNATLTGYSLTIKSLNFTLWGGETAAGATNYSFYLINGTYNVTIDVPGYELTNAQANITVSGNTNYTFTLYKENSVQITILDEITNALILSNITVRFTNNATTWENVTDTGRLFVYNITPSVYTILFYGSGYSTRTYTVTVGNRTTQTLNAYMISGNYSTILTIKDTDTADTISNVSVNMYKLINSTWTVVESKYSDISGRAMFYYDPIGSYKFYLSKTEYTDYVFFLNPILFSSYDVYMSRISILNASQDYDGVAVIYAPSSFQNAANTTFNFIINSPDGLLTEYGINLTFPTGGSTGDVGTNAIGSQLSAWVNITGATAYDRVRLDYYYISSTTGRHNFTAYFPIEFNTSASSLTFLSNKNKTYGLGIFERLLIVTLVVLFVVGIGTLVGQPIPAFGLGLFVFGYMAYIGFCPLWAILPSMFVGILFLVWKSGGY